MNNDLELLKNKTKDDEINEIKKTNHKKRDDEKIYKTLKIDEGFYRKKFKTLNKKTVLLIITEILLESRSAFLNSVVDPGFLYIQISILNKQVEAVCDSGASGSSLGEKLINRFNKNHQVKAQQIKTRLSTVNQMPDQIKGTVSVPIKIGPKKYEHTFYVLIEAASHCLLGHDFLKGNKCDAIFSESKLKIDRNTLVFFYRKHFSFLRKARYIVVAIEKVSIPPQHAMIVPGTIPG